MKCTRSTLAQVTRALAAHWAGYTIAVIPAAVSMGLVLGNVQYDLTATLAENDPRSLDPLPLWHSVGWLIGWITLVVGGSLALISGGFDLFSVARRQRSKRRHIIGMALTALFIIGLGGAIMTYGAMLVILPLFAISGALGGWVRWRLLPYGVLEKL